MNDVTFLWLNERDSGRHVSIGPRPRPRRRRHRGAHPYFSAAAAAAERRRADGHLRPPVT